MKLRPVALVPALLLALVAQTLLSRDFAIPAAAALYGVAFALCLWGSSRDEPESSSTQVSSLARTGDEQTHPKVAGVWPRILAGASLSCGLMGVIWLWINPRPGDAALLSSALWIASIMLFIAALYAKDGWPSPCLTRRTVLTEALPLAAIIMLAAIPRFYRLGELPPGMLTDEALVATMVTRLAKGMEGPITSPFEIAWIHVNLPYYLMALSVKAFGASIFSSRLVSASIGIISVIAFYFLSRQMFGIKASLAATLMLALSRWHFHMSRIGWENVIHVALFETLAFLFLLRGLKNGKPADYAWSGTSTALCVYMYHSGKLIVPMVGVVILFAAVGERKLWVPQFRWGMLAFAMAAVLTFAPLGVTIAKNPARYLSHINEVSLWRLAERNNKDLASLIVDNARAAALIFNYRGDQSPRHNIPNAPAMDVLSAALFAMGLAWGLLRVRTRQGLLLLSWLALGIAASIMSDNNRAMSRALGAIPPSLLLATGFAAQLWTQGTRFWQSKGRPAGNLAVIGAGLAIAAWFAISGLLNINAYFGNYVSLPNVLREYQNAEWQAGLAVSKLSGDYEVFVSPALADNLVLRYVTFVSGSQYRAIKQHDLSSPACPQSGKAFVLASEETSDISLLHHYYPEGNLEEILAPWGQPALAVFSVTGSYCRQRQGLLGHYAQASSQQETVLPHQEVIFSPGIDWPVAGVSTARWEGGIFAPTYGEYLFTISGNGQATLQIDGQQVAILLPSQGKAGGKVTLYPGMHWLILDYQAGTVTPSISLAWEPPPSTRPLADRASLAQPGPQPIPLASLSAVGPPQDTGLQGHYYLGTQWQGTPIFSRVDPTINYWWPRDEPIPEQSFSVEWTGWIKMEKAGQYRFDTFSHDGSWLYIDDRLVVDNGGEHPERWKESSLELQPGWHRIKVRYFQVRSADNFGPKGVRVFWSPPGQARVVIPSAVLRPGERMP